MKLRKYAGFLLLTASLAWSLVGLAVAAGECEQLCQQQYAEDLAQCVDAHQQALAQAAADREACLEQAQSFLDQLRCQTAYQSARSRADLARTRCEHQAESALAQCLVDCSQSPAAP
ncbi:MAG: hypothetical protein Q9Q40_10535 [Acidobacteriota bacterium]|nr:hypothetical protein [Acidobacteriota bacterium]MDQ7087898.1 hypothetical protein [Acidobacteriota bacterium]